MFVPNCSIYTRVFSLVDCFSVVKISGCCFRGCFCGCFRLLSGWFVSDGLWLSSWTFFSDPFLFGLRMAVVFTRQYSNKNIFTTLSQRSHSVLTTLSQKLFHKNSFTTTFFTRSIAGPLEVPRRPIAGPLQVHCRSVTGPLQVHSGGGSREDKKSKKGGGRQAAEVRGRHGKWLRISNCCEIISGKVEEG